MPTYHLNLKLLAAGCFIAAGSTPFAIGAVTDEDFAALKQAVEQLTEKVQTLETTHQTDQATIVQLQQQSARASAPAPAPAPEPKQLTPPTTEVAAVPPVEDFGLLATHSFSIVGDAEVQFGKTSGQHGAFALADFAPIFLFRGGDKVLFEAGFDFVLQNNAPGGSGYTTTVNLSFGTIDYLLNDYVTIVAGDMLLPLGTYSERSAVG